MEESSLKNKTVQGIFWKMLERFGAQSVSFIVSIVIARILSPEDYSIVSFVTIFFTFANLIISGGFNTALMQKKNADAEDYSAVMFISLVVAAVLYAIFYFFAPWLAALYNSDDLILVIRVMGLILPINGIKSVWCAYISTEMNFKKFFFATLVGTVISGFVGIIMAVHGRGAWALIAQQMTNTFIDTVVLMFTTRIKLVWKFSYNRLKQLFKYGWKIFLSSMFSAAYAQTIPLFIGLKFSKAELSFYTKGISFPDLITTATTGTLSAVLFPALAKIQDDKDALLNATRTFISTTSFVVFPVMLGFFTVSENLVKVLLTEKWLPVVPYIKIFCVAYMFDMVHVGNCETIKAMGRSDIYLIMELIKKVGYFITIALALLWSKSPLDLAFVSIIHTIIALAVNSIPNVKMIGYKMRYQVQDMFLNLVLSITMSVAVYLVGKVNLGAFATLLLQILSGAITYIFLNIVSNNPSFKYVTNNFQYLIKRKRNN